MAQVNFHRVQCRGPVDTTLMVQKSGEKTHLGYTKFVVSVEIFAPYQLVQEFFPSTVSYRKYIIDMLDI